LGEIIWTSEQLQISKIALKKDQFLPANICLKKGQIFAEVHLPRYPTGIVPRPQILMSKIALKKDQFLPARICLEEGQIFA